MLDFLNFSECQGHQISVGSQHVDAFSRDSQPFPLNLGAKAGDYMQSENDGERST